MAEKELYELYSEMMKRETDQLYLGALKKPRTAREVSRIVRRSSSCVRSRLLRLEAAGKIKRIPLSKKEGIAVSALCGRAKNLWVIN